MSVSAQDLCKSFRIPKEQSHTLKERALRLHRRSPVKNLQALRSVTFDVARGEFFGVVGRNGSGKSTLLKCLAGIYAIDSGMLAVDGLVAPFIELGVGFNPELTARDNLTVNAIMLGLSRKEARRRFDSIVEFAELEDFMDLKFKNYSSGMQVRLAFAVAIQIDADIMLIDEVLAVGDASFQQKCFAEFERLRTENRTVLFVSHSMSTVEFLCDRALLLDRGRVTDIGKPHDIARQYHAINFAAMRDEATRSGGPVLLQRGAAEIVGVQARTPDGAPVVKLDHGAACVISMRVHFHEAALNPIFAFGLYDERRRLAFGASSQLDIGPTGYFDADELATIRLEFTNWLGPGGYRVDVSVTRDGTGVDAFDLREGMITLYVSDDSATGGGAIDLPTTWELTRT